MANSGRCKVCHQPKDDVFHGSSFYSTGNYHAYQPEPISGEAQTIVEASLEILGVTNETSGDTQDLLPEAGEASTLKLCRHCQTVHEIGSACSSGGTYHSTGGASMRERELVYHLGQYVPTGAARPVSGTLCDKKQPPGPADVPCCLPKGHEGFCRPDYEHKMRPAVSGTEESAGPRDGADAAAYEILYPDGKPLEGYDLADVAEVAKIIRKHAVAQSAGLLSTRAISLDIAIRAAIASDQSPKYTARLIETVLREAAAPSLTPRPACPKCKQPTASIYYMGLSGHRGQCNSVDCGYAGEYEKFFSAQKSETETRADALVDLIRKTDIPEPPEGAL